MTHNRYYVKSLFYESAIVYPRLALTVRCVDIYISSVPCCDGVLLFCSNSQNEFFSLPPPTFLGPAGRTMDLSFRPKKKNVSYNIYSKIPW